MDDHQREQRRLNGIQNRNIISILLRMREMLANAIHDPEKAREAYHRAFLDNMTSDLAATQMRALSAVPLPHIHSEELQALYRAVLEFHEQRYREGPDSDALRECSLQVEEAYERALHCFPAGRVELAAIRELCVNERYWDIGCGKDLDPRETRHIARLTVERLREAGPKEPGF